MRAGQHDDVVVLRLNEVVAMLRNPQTLMAPALHQDQSAQPDAAKRPATRA